MLCWLLMGVFLLLQAIPALEAALSQTPPAEILHSDSAYLPPAPEKADTLLDVNQASAADFDALPGIGPVYAGSIVEYRENISRFYFLEDLMNVKGIGEKRLESIRPFLMELWPLSSPQP